ncbi:glycosyltransferase family 4 protein [Alphaproteobacteria bacterium]|nr:glycosyltransferase family 4 protein [Alphaproteobacteria bacterium]
MKALFVHDTYYYGTEDADDEVYAFGAFPYALWKERYLSHFDDLQVIGRSKRDLDDFRNKLDRSDGPGVMFLLFQNINTPVRRLFYGFYIQNTLNTIVKDFDVVIIRGPSEFGMMAAKAARRAGVPYCVEMSGCAFDHTWYHGSFIGKLYAPFKYLRARAMVHHADFVLYVTKGFLQRRYPTNAQVVENASNVELVLPDNGLIERKVERLRGTEKLVFGLIGNYGNNLKGLGVAFKALSRIKDALPAFELRILGQGDPAKWRPMVEALELQDHVVFSDSVPGGEAVYEWLDGIDIYLQPSFHEGLPRALIEAMSRGCPALASDAGGSDELLEARFIHRRGDASTLAKGLLVLAKDQDLQIEQARRNFDVVKPYNRELLKEKRFQFYKQFKALAEKRA